MNKGISLINLIITIIVIIILAAIVLFNGLNTPNSANFAKFTQQVDNVQMAVTDKYGKLLEKHSLANESRTQEQIYLEIATGADQGINSYMCTTGDQFKTTSNESTGIQNITVEGAKNTSSSIGMTLPKVRETNEAWYVTKDGIVFNATGFEYDHKTYYTGAIYQEEDVPVETGNSVSRAETIYEGIKKGTNVIGEIQENGTGSGSEINIGEGGEEPEELINQTNEEVQTYGLIFDSATNSIMYDGVYNPRHAISGYTSIYNMDLVIPNTVDGVPVKHIPNYGFGELAIGLSFNSTGQYFSIHPCNAKSIIVPNSVETIGEKAFARCQNLVTIQLPNGLQVIDDCTFYECTKLENIVIPNSVTTIKYSAFYKCTSLSDITIPISVTTLGSSVFQGCTNLHDIHYNGTKSQWNSISGSQSIYNITIHCTDGDIYQVPTYCCFDADSPVLMADGTIKNIQDITVGDMVMSLNEDTGEYISQKVTRTITKHHSDDLVFVHLSNGTRIGMRAYHPLLTTEGWKSLRPELAETTMDVGETVDLLKVGDTLIGYDENVTIVSIEERPAIENYDTYNFSVEGYHNYIVNGIVAHNAGEPCKY